MNSVKVTSLHCIMKMFPCSAIMLVAILFLLCKGSLVQKEAISDWTRKQPSCPFSLEHL
jgi:hypothetical protein